MKKIIWTVGVIILTLRAISKGNEFDAQKGSKFHIYFMGSCVVFPTIGLITVIVINYFR